MMFRSLIPTVVAVLPLLASANSGVIDVVTSEYPPYEYRENGKVVGSDTRVVRDVLAEMGYQANIRILPWARAETLVRSGEADMLYSLTFSKSRSRHYHFTDPISEAKDVFFKHSSNDLRWQTLDDLAGLDFGLSASYSYAPDFMDWLFDDSGNITRISHEQPELTGLRLVGLERIDLFVCAQSVCDFLLEQMAGVHQELALVDQMPGQVGATRSFHAAFARELPNGAELRDRFNDALETVLGADAN